MSIKRHVYQIESIATQLFSRFAQAQELFLFGSRRHRTLSERSDIDLILKHKDYLRPLEVREFIDEECQALDIFLVQEGSRAVSVVNESYVESDNFSSLLEVLSAVKIWDADNGKVEDADADWEMTVRADVIFTKTMLPNALISLDHPFLDTMIVKDTPGYIVKIVNQINACYVTGNLDACAVMCRRLVETLIIEVYESKALGSTIKKDGNYLMLDALINFINTEKTFDIGRLPKKALPVIKTAGDQSAHGRYFIAKYNDMKELGQALRIVVEALVLISGIQKSTL